MLVIICALLEHSQNPMPEIEEILQRYERNPNLSLAPVTSVIKRTDTNTLLAVLPRIPRALVQMVFDREPSEGDIICMIERDPSVYCAFLRRYQSIGGDEFGVLLTYLECKNFEVVSEVLLVIEHFMTNQFDDVRDCPSFDVGVKASYEND